MVRSSYGRIAAVLTGAAIVASLSSATLVAGTATATLTVTATVSAECTVTGATLAFGTYSTLSSSNLDQTTTFAVACTTGTSASIGMDLGSNASGAARRMSNGGAGRLTYELYSDSGRTTVWGSSGGGLVAYSATSNAAQNFTVYGRAAGSQNVPTGSYTDSVTVTVTF